MTVSKIVLEEKFNSFNELWDPRIIAELNGQHVKIAKVNGDFVMHQHESEDELFMVISGTLYIELETATIELMPGEIVVIPRGTEHRPYSKVETQILMFEPKSTVNTGNLENEFTVKNLKSI